MADEITETTTETTETTRTLLGGGAPEGADEGAGMHTGPDAETAQDAAQNDPAASGEDWRADLPRDWTVRVRGEDGQESDIPLAEHPALAKYASKDEAVKALVHAQGLLGRKGEGLKRPGEDAGEEEWNDFYKGIGVPENPDGYDLAAPEEMPEGYEMPEGEIEEIKAAFHDMRLTPEQAQQGMDVLMGKVRGALDQQAEEARALAVSEFQALRQEHKGETKAVLDKAQRAALALGGDELVAALGGAGNSRAVINAFARVGDMLGEAGLKGGGEDSGAPMTKETLRAMMRDPRYHDPVRRDPGYVKRVEDGFKRLYPGERSGSRE